MPKDEEIDVLAKKITSSICNSAGFKEFMARAGAFDYLRDLFYESEPAQELRIVDLRTMFNNALEMMRKKQEQ